VQAALEAIAEKRADWLALANALKEARRFAHAAR
jgi:hypothetical protein